MQKCLEMKSLSNLFFTFMDLSQTVVYGKRRNKKWQTKAFMNMSVS